MADAISSLVFINCGGSIPLHREWFYGEQYNMKAYIIDSHRPLHNLNVTDESQKIIVIDDGCKSFQECPSLDDYQMLEALNNMRGDEDEDEFDEEGDDDEPDSSDDEAGMEKRGLIDDEEEADEAEKMMGAAAAGGGGQEGAEIIERDLGGRTDAMGMDEVRAAIREDKEKEEAKQELADLRGSDDDDDQEAGYKEGGAA